MIHGIGNNMDCYVTTNFGYVMDYVFIALTVTAIFAVGYLIGKYKNRK